MEPVTGTIAITGVTGRLGGRVARRLAASGVPQRLLARSPERAPTLPRAMTVGASYGDHGAVREALAGIETVLMVSASETPDRVHQHQTFIDAAAAAGVGHLVYISFLGAAPDATFTLARDHWASEEAIRASGMEFTLLRDNLYADFVPLLAGADGVIRGPAGQGRVSVVAQDDIAEAAVAVLRDPSAHQGRSYDLTGPEALTLTEAAQLVTEVLGTPTTYESETIDEAYASRASYGAPQWQVDGWVSTYTAIAAGDLASISPAIMDLTGHPATSLATVLRATSSTSREE